MHKKPQYARDGDNPSAAVLALSGWGYAGSGLYNALGRAVVLPHLSGVALGFALLLWDKVFLIYTPTTSSPIYT